ncbi:ABC transporter substrate binding protein [Gemella bergeri ATCC 700627]|uniref:ABC transporter substrate binding protein n=2 Tax=Gemella bergeri TaxID=84136 RepID=U2RX44_9BACL|nr:ABC transporter substrate binding protein [Gemella bergeri ATCC 700627]
MVFYYTLVYIKTVGIIPVVFFHIDTLRKYNKNIINKFKGDIKMKINKIFVAFAVLLVCVLGYGVYTHNKGNETSKQQENKEVKVGVLQLLSHPALDQIYKGLEDGLAKEGYVVGKNLKIDLQNAQGDQSNLASMGQKLVSDNNDILVGITTPATLSLSNSTKDKPIIMAGITYPVEAGLIQTEDKPGNNITGVSDRTPIKQQLEIMKKVLPNMKKVGILYTASEDNAVKQAQEAEKLAKELGLETKTATVANTNDIQQVTENLASQTDAIFVPIDNTIASAMATVVKVTDAKKIPVFPSADTMVADGGVLGLGVDQYKIGLETAKVVAKVLKGEDTKTMPIVLANEGVIYLNEAKAKQLGIEIPKDIKDKAKIVDKK